MLPKIVSYSFVPIILESTLNVDHIPIVWLDLSGAGALTDIVAL